MQKHDIVGRFLKKLFVTQSSTAVWLELKLQSDLLTCKISLSFNCCRVKYTPDNDLSSCASLANKIQDGGADR